MTCQRSPGAHIGKGKAQPKPPFLPTLPQRRLISPDPPKMNFLPSFPLKSLELISPPPPPESFLSQDSSPLPPCPRKVPMFLIPLCFLPSASVADTVDEPCLPLSCSGRRSASSPLPSANHQHCDQADCSVFPLLPCNKASAFASLHETL